MTLSALLRAIADRYQAALASCPKNCDSPTATRCERPCEECLKSHRSQNKSHETTAVAVTSNPNLMKTPPSSLPT